MSVFSHADFDNHEKVVFCCDPESGLKAIIAIHNTNRGPALGGCRMWPYATDQEALRDVLRLSRGMTYKSALANLGLGGGKSVIIGDPRQHKTPQLLRAMGRALESLGGHYIAAEDSGTGVADLKIMSEESLHVAGITDKYDADGQLRNGDPSPSTAYGVFTGLKAAVEYRLGQSDLAGLKVAIQGVGNVGYRLARHLHQAGAKLYIADIHEEQIQRCVDEFGATAVNQEQIHCLDVDIFSPCALGGALNDETIPQLRAKVVAGAANNQLAESRHGQALMERGILYAPDYVINAGGIIDIAYERTGYDQVAVRRHIEGIRETLLEILQRADTDGVPTNQIADRLAEERFRQ